MWVHSIHSKIWYLDDSEGINSGQLVIGSFLTAIHPLMHHVWCRVFWWNIKSPRWLSPATAQIWCPVSSGFSQNENHLQKGRDFRPLMRSRKIWWGSWWQLRELCEVPSAYFEGDWGVFSYVQCFVYLVSSSIDVSIFHSAWLDTFWTDLGYTPMTDVCWWGGRVQMHIWSVFTLPKCKVKRAFSL